MKSNNSRLLNILKPDAVKTATTSPLKLHDEFMMGPLMDWRAKSFTGFHISFFTDVLRNILSITLPQDKTANVCLNKNKWLEPPEGFEPSAC